MNHAGGEGTFRLQAAAGIDQGERASGAIGAIGTTAQHHGAAAIAVAQPQLTTAAADGLHQISRGIGAAGGDHTTGIVERHAAGVAAATVRSQGHAAVSTTNAATTSSHGLGHHTNAVAPGCADPSVAVVHHDIAGIAFGVVGPENQAVLAVASTTSTGADALGEDAFGGRPQRCDAALVVQNHITGVAASAGHAQTHHQPVLRGVATAATDRLGQDSLRLCACGDQLGAAADGELHGATAP